MFDITNIALREAKDAPVAIDAASHIARNAANLAASQALKNAKAFNVAGMVWRYNAIVGYGQSFSNGWESWPALSTTAVDGNIMVGNSVRPADQSADSWISQGGDSFQPLVATNDKFEGSSICQLNEAAVAALPLGDATQGETVLQGMANFAKMLHNRRLGVLTDSLRLFVANTAGVEGRAIEELQSGASPNLWGRVTGLLVTIRSIADAARESSGVVAFVYDQGQANAGQFNPNVFDTTKTGYKTKLATMRTNFFNLCFNIFGQQKAPLMMLSQVAGAYVTDAEGTDTAAVAPAEAHPISMAQFEFAMENEGIVLVAPDYAFTWNGFYHLDNNGQRWRGQKFGEVFHRVVERGEKWLPLSPRKNADGTYAFTLVDRELIIDFHAPEPPLSWGQPRKDWTALDVPNFGFTGYDSNGEIAIESVSILLDTMVRIVFWMPPVGETYILYADRLHCGGYGNLMDSAGLKALNHYSYIVGSGQARDANVTALVGSPYPLNNFCIAFNLRVQ